MTTYIEYLRNTDSLTLESMDNMLREMLSEIGTDIDAKELFDELLEKAIKYTEIRAKWNLMNGSERAEADAGRTICHDSLIVKFNQLAKYLRINGKSAGWRDQLGYDDSDRKRIGDFAAYIVFVSCLNAR